MATIKDVAAYICMNYPHKWELSKARLTKMVYLADWRSAIVRGTQITSIHWEFNHFGPYVEDVVALARTDDDFAVQRELTVHGDEKEVITVPGYVACDSLSEVEREILDLVIASTQSKYWAEFIKLVYSTYPIVTQPRCSTLDLVELARQYKEEQNLIGDAP